MADSRYSPSVRRRRLSALLRRLREERGLKIEDVNRRLEWASGKLSRMERNEWKRPSIRDMQDLAEVYALIGGRKDAIVSLAREARTRGWWVDYKDILRGGLADFEVGASMIRNYESVLVPGLLQTPEYASAILRSGRVLGDEEIKRKVAARMQRQQILEQASPPRLWAVVDEAALIKNVGGADVMQGQLQHLIDMARKPNIDIQVVRQEVGAYAAMDGSFVILDFPTPEDLSLAYIETATEDLYVEDPEAIQQYVSIFGHTCGVAETPEESAAFLQSLVNT